MKLMHISDLHLGKRLHACSLLEDQRLILDQIVSTAVKRTLTDCSLQVIFMIKAYRAKKRSYYLTHF